MVHPRPYYYLENFRTALGWLKGRYEDLLSDAERAFIFSFERLPQCSAALLVRMIGRRGELFRAAQLNYREIADLDSAVTPLIDLQWLDSKPHLTRTELGRLLRRQELLRMCPGLGKGFSKQVLLQSLEAHPRTSGTLADWWPGGPFSESIFRLLVRSICDGLKLMFFGNFHQDWSQFVLAELGIFKYEKVARENHTRAFQTRAEVDTFHRLFACRQGMQQGVDIRKLLSSFPKCVPDNEWLEGRRAQLLFQMAQHCERSGDVSLALDIYRSCAYPGSRMRVIRLLERCEQFAQAATLAAEVQQCPADETERQQLERVASRLLKGSGPRVRQRRQAHAWQTFAIEIPEPDSASRVEQAAANALARPNAPVHFVGNGLINSLFGLLCWDAIFAPIGGAFFHEFQSGPADLNMPQFGIRRSAEFARSLGQLSDGSHRQTIRYNFERKAQIQSPFVRWGRLTRQLLDLALNCLPGADLRLCFERLLEDIRTNRSGLPDLIQFWPEERRYRLIEVKGPGDRLQDNQIRWLRYCATHAMPVAVCHVVWRGAPALDPAEAQIV